MASFADALRKEGPQVAAPPREGQPPPCSEQGPSDGGLQTEEVDSVLLDAILFQSRHETDGFTRCYGGLLLRNACPEIRVDQSLVRREMGYLAIEDLCRGVIIIKYYVHLCSSESLVSRSDLRDLLLQCCADEAPDVRQSALALLGDLVKACALYLQPRLAEFLNLAAKQLVSKIPLELL